MPHIIGGEDPESFWSKFLDTHTLTRDEEEAFWAYITETPQRVPKTYAIMEQSYVAFCKQKSV